MSPEAHDPVNAQTRLPCGHILHTRCIRCLDCERDTAVTVSTWTNVMARMLPLLVPDSDLLEHMDAAVRRARANMCLACTGMSQCSIPPEVYVATGVKCVLP